MTKINCKIAMITTTIASALLAGCNTQPTFHTYREPVTEVTTSVETLPPGRQAPHYHQQPAYQQATGNQYAAPAPNAVVTTGQAYSPEGANHGPSYSPE